MAANRKSIRTSTARISGNGKKDFPLKVKTPRILSFCRAKWPRYNVVIYSTIHSLSRPTKNTHTVNAHTVNAQRIS
jgi:hypothetical protein